MKGGFHVTNIGTCVTLDPKAGEGPLGLIRDAVIEVAGGKVVQVGPRKKFKPAAAASEEIDAGGALVTPGLIDCHTHLVFAGSRADEFFARLQGDSYEAIAKRGGGIQKTVDATSKASDGELLNLVRARLDRFLKFGVTTVEIKSGYGLSLERELRLLRLISKLEHPVAAVPTFLGAHIVPAEYRVKRDAYVRLICEDMLPAVKKENLASICDVFCEEGAFTLEETRTILAQARKLGFQVKLHADQLTSNGGAELAAEFKALSADHLEHISDAGIRALAKSGTVAVLLPGAVFSLGKNNFPPARKLIDAGVSVAISTDCNPGTSHTENLPLMMSFAATELRMTPEEIWPAVTANAARALALSDRGRIVPGLRADLVIWDAASPEEIPYRCGVNLAKRVLTA